MGMSVSSFARCCVQMSNMEDLYKHLDQLVDDNNQTYGPGKWLVAYGGDPANKERPDVGLAMQYLSSKKGVHVLAVQCKEYGDYMRANGSTTKLNDHYNFVVRLLFSFLFLLDTWSVVLVLLR
jgi:hypothetical protein